MVKSPKKALFAILSQEYEVWQKMTYPIWLEILRGFWKCYWKFLKIYFSWSYDVIMTSFLVILVIFLRIHHRFRLITSCKPYYMGETHTLSYRKINEEHNETIFKSQKLIFRKLWRHNDVILSVFVFSVVYKTAKFKVILRVSGFKNVTFLLYFFDRNILRPKPAS